MGGGWRYSAPCASGEDLSCTLCCAATCQKPLGFFLLHKLLEMLENRVVSHSGFIFFMIIIFYVTTSIAFPQVF